MGIESLTDRQVSLMISRYEERDLTEGGRYSLAELKLEQLRRVHSPLPHVEVARKIVELAEQSEDGLITYRDIWEAFRPGEPWRWPVSNNSVNPSLARVVEYCIRNQLPIPTVLVVQEGKRKLSPEAVQNIYGEARALGVDVGLDAEVFVDRERERARQVVSASLPDDAVNSAAA
jgi:hypothetical protein